MILEKRLQRTFMFCSISEKGFLHFFLYGGCLRSKIYTREICTFTSTHGLEVASHPEIASSEVGIPLKAKYFSVLKISDYIFPVKIALKSLAIHSQVFLTNVY